MNILITLDYELFLGTQTGTIENCLIKPSDEIIRIANKHNIRLVFFVDATYLLRLNQLKDKYDRLKSDLEIVSDHIKKIHQVGHEIQLHIHPHWMYSQFDGEKWIIDRDRYKISDLPPEDVDLIIDQSKSFLDNIIGDKTFVYRAGGFSVQPFKKVANVLLKNNVKFDSSVFFKGRYTSHCQEYDFLNVPDKTCYSFSDNILEDVETGKFVEYPISSIDVSPFFYWKMVFIRFILRLNKFKVFGDGMSIDNTNTAIFEKLTKSTRGLVSFDGFKASYLNKALNYYKKTYGDKCDLVIISHPKAISKYSLQKFETFIIKNKKEHNFTSFKEKSL